MPFIFGKLVGIAGPYINVEVDYPVYQIESKVIEIPDTKAKIRAIKRLYPENQEIVLLEVEDGWRPKVCNEVGECESGSLKRITQSDLRSIVPSTCPECGSTDMRVFANTVMSGASLEFEEEGKLAFEAESRDAIADLAWGYGCLNCDYRHYFADEMQIDWT